jgi:uncharacterized protein YqiB (DUF1249 family)
MIITRRDPAQAGLQVLPGTFASLMDLYERNYIGIRRLIPLMPPAQTRQVSPLPGGLDLHLEVLERFRYTTELFLTYHFPRGTGAVAEPDLRIRIYHDARLAEVMAAQLRHRPEFRIGEEDAKTQLSTRWQVNRFLYKWLNYCLHQGHRFGRDSQTA